MEVISKHQGVLLDKSTNLLKPTSKKVYLDGTFGGGGHSRKLLELTEPSGKVIALDRDPNTEIFTKKLLYDFPGRFEFHCLSFDQVGQLGHHFDGAILDLGLSTDQLESSGRGFSFSRNEPLDLRFDDRFGQTAAQFLMQSSPSEIERVFKEYGEDRYAKKLAVRIVNDRRSRTIRTTEDFIHYIGTNNPKVLAPLFQALRIVVNDEIDTLKNGLEEISESLVGGAILSVISFHSIEDRIVKQFFRLGDFQVITKKPITPGDDELLENSRSRSAKLRAGIKNLE